MYLHQEQQVVLFITEGLRHIQLSMRKMYKTLEKIFFVVPSDRTMQVNPVSNWIMGSKNNIEYLCENIKLTVVNAYDKGSADEYTNYTLKAVGNYIRFVDENKPASPLKSGAIKLADITLSSDGTSYEVYYEVTTDGKEYKRNSYIFCSKSEGIRYFKRYCFSKYRYYRSRDYNRKYRNTN